MKMEKNETIVADDVRQVALSNDMVSMKEIINAFKDVFCRILDRRHRIDAKSGREQMQKFWLEAKAENFDWDKTFANLRGRLLANGVLWREPFAFRNFCTNYNGSLIKNVTVFIWEHQRYFEAAAFKFFHQIETELQARLKNNNLTDKQRRIIKNRLSTVDDCIACFLDNMNYIVLIERVLKNKRGFDFMGTVDDIDIDIKNFIEENDNHWFKMRYIVNL